MAIAVVKTYGHDLAEFIVDTENEVSDLPTVGYGPGSEAFCVETGDTYIMSASRAWGVKLTSGSYEATIPDEGGSDSPPAT